jgi:hypothetical protein
MLNQHRVPEQFLDGGVAVSGAFSSDGVLLIIGGLVLIGLIEAGCGPPS